MSASPWLPPPQLNIACCQKVHPEVQNLPVLLQLKAISSVSLRAIYKLQMMRKPHIPYTCFRGLFERKNLRTNREKHAKREKGQPGHPGKGGCVWKSLIHRRAVVSLQVSIGWPHLGTPESGCALFKGKTDKVWEELLEASYISV